VKCVVNHPIRRGRLTETDHDAIIMFSAKKYTPGRIASIIERHPSTVRFYMYSHGLMSPPGRYRVKPCVRNGRLVKPFDRDEDVFIQVLRIQGYTTTKIAEMTTKRFGHPRTPATIVTRLKMLAAMEEARHG